MDPKTQATDRFSRAIAAGMQYGGGDLVAWHRGLTVPIRIRILETSGGHRPDGLREDAPTNTGFSVAVASAALVVDRERLDSATLARVHSTLVSEGSDDWMEYSHLCRDPALHPEDLELGLMFSSAHKGAAALSDVLEAMQLSPADVELR